MIYYNQFTGEKRYVSDDLNSYLTRPSVAAINVQHKPNPLAKKSKGLIDSFKKVLPEKLGISQIHPENLNFDYIISHLETDDVLLGGIILLLVTDSADTDIPLILALVFLLVSEWIFDETDNSLPPTYPNITN